MSVTTSSVGRSLLTVGRRRQLTAGLLVTPALGLILLLFMIPLVRLIVHSFTTPTLGLQNYSDALMDRTTWRIIRITIEIAFECTAVSLLIGYPVAYLMATSSKRATKVILLFVLLPFWTSILVRMYAWMIILGTKGMINDALLAARVIDDPVKLLYTRFAVILGMIHYLLPFMILSLYSTMTGIDRDLMQSSSTLGASGWQSFWRVYFPLSAPGVFAGSLLVFILGLGFFVTPALLGGPRDTTMPMYIQQRVAVLQFDQATAIAVVLVVIVLILFAIYDRILGFDRLFGGLGT